MYSRVVFCYSFHCRNFVGLNSSIVTVRYCCELVVLRNNFVTLHVCPARIRAINPFKKSIMLRVNRCIIRPAFNRSHIWHEYNVFLDAGASKQKVKQHLATCFRYTAIRNTNFLFCVAFCMYFLFSFYSFALKKFSTIVFDSCSFVTRIFFKTSTRFGKGRYVNKKSK
jgi:hypothetical protein